MEDFELYLFSQKLDELKIKYILELKSVWKQAYPLDTQDKKEE